MKKKYLITITALLIFSCATVTPPMGNTKVMTFCMDSGNLKYYIRPSKMQSVDANDKSYVLIDFTYQMRNRNYVSSAYTNFTVYCKTNAFIEQAFFLIQDEEPVNLSEIYTLDRDVSKDFIRVSTLLENKHLEKVLVALNKAEASLVVKFDTGLSKTFIPTKDIIDKINEAFSK